MVGYTMDKVVSKIKEIIMSTNNDSVIMCTSYDCTTRNVMDVSYEDGIFELLYENGSTIIPEDEIRCCRFYNNDDHGIIELNIETKKGDILLSFWF